MRDIILRALYPFRDAKLEVGHSILTVQECIRLSLNDFTVIEVRSAAIIGLLYELAKEMFSLGLNIRFAKFDRDKEYMSGDFYVRDPLGQKIFDEKQIEDIKKSIFGITK